MPQNNARPRFAVCVKNDGYLASLEPRKIYPLVLDEKAVKHHLIRVIDESGEDYLYPTDFFVPIEVPQTWKKCSRKRHDACNHFAIKFYIRSKKERMPDRV